MAVFVHMCTNHALPHEHIRMLTCAGLFEELGFKIGGTTDVALVRRSAVKIGHAVTGIRWLWELNKDPQAHAAVPEQVCIHGQHCRKSCSKVSSLEPAPESAC